MGVILEVKPDLSNLPTILQRYEGYLHDVTDNLRLKGKPIGEANSEQPAWLVYYDQKKVELKSILGLVEMHLDRIKGNLWEKFTEVHSRDLSSRDKEAYIKKDPNYTNAYQLLLCVQELYDKYNSVVDAFVARGFSLRNITNLRVAQVEHGLM